MRSLLCSLFALAALCSHAIAATPLNLAQVASESDSKTQGRVLLAGIDFCHVTLPVRSCMRRAECMHPTHRLMPMSAGA